MCPPQPVHTSSPRAPSRRSYIESLSQSQNAGQPQPQSNLAEEG